MTASLAATAAALIIGLPIIAIGELLRDREERRLNRQPTTTTATGKDTP